MSSCDRWPVPAPHATAGSPCWRRAPASTSRCRSTCRSPSWCRCCWSWSASRGPGLAPGAVAAHRRAGGPLPSAATLDELAVPDGELLRLAPATRRRPPPCSTTRSTRSPRPRADGTPALGGRFGAGALLAVAVAAAAVSRPPGPLVGARRGGVAGRRGGGVGGSRGSPGAGAHGSGTAGHGALVAVPVAGRGRLDRAAGDGRRPGAAQPAARRRGRRGRRDRRRRSCVRVVAPALIAVVVAAVLIGCGADRDAPRRRARRPRSRRHRGPRAGGRAAAPAGRASGSPGCPRPVVPADRPSRRRRRALPPAELAERAALARGYLAGLTGGCAVVAAAAVAPRHSTPQAGAGSVPRSPRAAVARWRCASRGYADTVPARTTWPLRRGRRHRAGRRGRLGSTGRRCGPASPCSSSRGARCWSSGRAPRRSRRSPGGSSTCVEGVLVVAAVPLALGAMGLYAIVRGL